MICDKCKTEFFEGDFCPECGTKVDRSDLYLKQAKNDEDAFGKHSTDDGVIPVYVGPPKKSHKKLKITIAVIAAILIIAGISVLVWYLTRPKKIVDNIIDKDMYYQNNNGEIYKFSDGNTSKYNGNVEGKIPKNVVTKLLSFEHNKAVYVISDEKGLEVHSINEKGDITVQSGIIMVNNIVISRNGKYFAYAVSHNEVRQIKDREAEGGVRDTIVAVYDLYKVSDTGENIKIKTQDYEIEPVVVDDEGNVIYSSADKNNLIYDGNGKESEFGSGAVKIVYYQKTQDYVYVNDNNDVYKGNIQKKEETLITTDISDIYDVGTFQDDDKSNEGLDVNQVNSSFTSDSTDARIIYVKNNGLFYKKINDENDSIKLAGQVSNLESIKCATQNCIYYIDNKILYRIKISDGSASNEKIAEGMISFDTGMNENEYIYLKENDIVYGNGENEETLIKGKAAAYDIYLFRNYIIYRGTDANAYKYDRNSKEVSKIDMLNSYTWTKITKKEEVRYE